MILRKHIIPRNFKDLLCFLFVLFIIPFVYWFELFVVIPTYYPLWSFWYNFHFVCGNFVAMNLITNLVALVLVDTSVKGHILPVELKPGWHFCSVCEIVAPPRSWHCDVCNTCILKRDHHCMFAGTCVGHYNSRYFMMFVIYMFLATIYSTYFNTFFILPMIDVSNKWTWLKIVFPLAMFVLENTTAQLYLLLYLLVIFTMVFVAVLIWFHTTLLLNGQITHERNVNKRGFDFGLVRNIEIIYGEKWYLTWLSPFIISKLPHDGINWEHKETVKSK